MTKRSAGMILVDQDVSPARSAISIRSTSSPWSGMRSVPGLGPMTPLHSPSSEEEQENSARLFSRRPRASLGSRYAIINGHRASLSTRKENSRASLSVRKNKENHNRENIENLPGLKRKKVDNQVRVPFGDCQQFRGVSSSVSTSAGSTPASTPANSPQVSPNNTPKHALVEKVDYNSLSVDELREQLGVTGTDIVSGWEKEDLISVLTTLEAVIADMPALDSSIPV